MFKHLGIKNKFLINIFFIKLKPLLRYLFYFNIFISYYYILD